MTRYLLTAAFAVACVSAYADEPVVPTRDMREIVLTVKFGTQSEIIDQCIKLGAWGGDEQRARTVARSKPMGCATFYPSKPACTVYVVKPDTVDDERTRTLGHEVLHCILGVYHE